MICIIENYAAQILALESKRPATQLLSSWFDQNYEYRVEEGDLRYSPSKIEAVRIDGGDFDDLYLQNLKIHLVSSVFPSSIYTIDFEVDDFRRFVRIYVDHSAHGSHVKKKNEKIQHWSVVSKDEIQSRLANPK